MSSPILSICIPTYNRAQYLEVSLDALIVELQDFSDQVEIVVSDNASTDTTREIVERAKMRFAHISYSRNEENLGYDRNLDLAIRHAQGKYCWFLSDDERILPGGIKMIFDIIATYPDAAYFCFDVRGNSIRRLPTETLTYLHDGEELLREYGIIGGLISQNIILRELYPKNTQKYFGNFWIHLSIIFEIIRDKPLVMIDASVTKGQRDVCTWAVGGKGLFTYSSLKNIILSLPSLGYSKDIVTLLIREFLPSFPRILISAKIQGLQFSITNLHFIIDQYRAFPLELISGIIIFFVPSFLLRFLSRILGK